MKLEYDPAKDAANQAKQGLSLGFGARLFDDAMHLLLSSIRPVDGEERFKIIGMVDGQLYTGVHVHRGDAVRFVSVRRSNSGEERLYHRA